ncbi:MAG: M23 family metallopeptidase [Anaerolineales bacterium]|nr:M23 family metallopeptidase [Anaerolineales bacterium]MCW5855468.1 M23 family metallopeptidase [Anaerolineales bacterium]
MKRRKAWRMPTLLVILALLVLVGAAGLYIYRNYFRPIGRWAYFSEIHTSPQIFERYALQPGLRCGDAPFAFPTTGVILGLWDESYRIGHRHSGVDIFSGTQPGVTPIYAAYPGYLTRQPDWKSTVIIRIPSDPLQPGRQIWTYYTHLADQQGQSFISEAFPPDSHEVYVEAGTFLGYMGNYSGDPAAPTGLHLHFSVVKDEEDEFLNELDIRNTYDPSPYFGLVLNHRQNAEEIPVCAGEATFEPWELHHDGP